jgi:hypothetical protein
LQAALEAGDSLQGAGAVYMEAVRLARCLIALGDRQAPTEPLQKARGIFSRLGAVPVIEEADSYLRAEAASSATAFEQPRDGVSSRLS